MNQPNPNPSAEAAQRRQVVLWLAMALSVGMYFVVVPLVQPAAVQENPTLVRTLLAVALGLVAVSFPIKGRLQAQAGPEGDPGRQQAAHIVALVLCEAAAVLGIVVRFVTGSAQCYWFLVLGLAGILLHYPRRQG